LGDTTEGVDPPQTATCNGGRRSCCPSRRGVS
jgi:hypothetical protein